MIRRLTSLLLLVLLVGPPRAQAAPERGCELSGVITRGGKPTAARIEARLIWKPPVGVHALDPSGYRDGHRQWLDSPSSLTSPTATVDVKKDGAFLLRGLDYGTYELRAVSDSGSVILTHVHLPAPGVRKRVALDAAPGEQVLAGKALRADGTPFRGWVMVTQPQYGHDATPLCRGVPAARVADDGSFQVQGLEGGEARVLLVSPGTLRTEGLRLQLPQSKPVRVVVPKATRCFTAQVVAQGDEKPVAGARVFCRNDEDEEILDLRGASTDAEGKFSMLAPDESSWLRVSARGFEPRQIGLSEEVPSTIALRRLGSVSGRVVASDGGEPVAGALVHALPRERRGNAPVMHAITTENGSFTLRGVPRGEAMVFVLGGGFASPRLSDARHWGYNPWLVQVQAGRDTPVELLAERAGRATGRIRGADGDPVVGAVVFAQSEGIQYPEDRRVMGWLPDLVEKGVSRDDGTFELTTILPGERYELVGRSGGLADCFSHPAHFEESEHLRFQLEAPAPRWIEVQTRDGNGSPVRGATIYVKYHGSRGGRWFPLDAHSNSAGEVRLGPLGPGRLEILGYAADHLDSPWQEIAPDRGAQDHDPYVITLPGREWIRGRVVAPEGHALATVRVESRPPWTEAWSPVTCGEDGAFGFLAYAGLPYRIRAHTTLDGKTWEASEFAEAPSTGSVLRLAPAAARTASRSPKSRPKDDAKAAKPGPKWIIRVRTADGDVVETARATIHEVPAPGKWGGMVLGPADIHKTIEYEPCLDEGSSTFLEIFAMVKTDGTPILGAGFLGPLRGTPGEVELRLGRGREIRGRVLDERGEPVRGAVVAAQGVYAIKTLRKRGSIHGRARTGADGTFTLTGPPLARYDVVVDAGSSYSKPDPLPHESETGAVVIRLRRFAPVRIRVLLPDGTPLLGAWVRLGSRTDKKTDISGDAFYVGLDPSKQQGLRVDVGIPNPWSGSKTLERPDLLPFFNEGWLPKDTTIGLAPAYEIAGKVETKTKADLKDLVVCFRKVGAAEHSSAEVEGDSSFRVGQLAEGEYELWTQRGNSLLAEDVPEGPKLKVRSGAKDVRLAPPRR